MRISLKQDSDAPYYANIEIATATVDLETNFQVPIRLQKIKGKAMYAAEICGFTVEGDSPQIVIGLLEKLVPGLINMARLPTYVFIARRSHKMYPVYTHGDDVFATTPGGPLFKHVELAKVREYLMDYLNEIRELGVPGKSEKLHVRGINRHDLSLTRPIFYLKKRPEASNDHEFWAPVFVSDNGNSIYTYAASGKREVDIDHGHEVLRLRSQVAQALIADKRLKDDYDLRADRLLPEYWEKVKPGLMPLSKKLVFNGTKLDIYEEGKNLVAVEHRLDEDRYSFYIGHNEPDLKARAASDLLRRGFIKDASVVKIEG